MRSFAVTRALETTSRDHEKLVRKLSESIHQRSQTCVMGGLVSESAAGGLAECGRGNLNPR